MLMDVENTDAGISFFNLKRDVFFWGKFHAKYAAFFFHLQKEVE